MKKGKRKQVDRAQYVRYRQVARSLLSSVNDLNELAQSDDNYGNAIAIIAVHCAIAFSDALCIHSAGYKSTERDHNEAIEALQDALGTRSETSVIRKLQRVIARKDQVSYQGSYFTVSDAQQMVRDVNEFADWAEDILQTGM